MMITDPFVVGLFHPPKWLQYGVEVFFLVGVLVVGKLWIRYKISREEKDYQASPARQSPDSEKKE
jgi:heme exporter protein D